MASTSKTTTSYAIGIDLGTTNSCVAVWLNGKVEIIANSDGSRTTPSLVAFDNQEIFIGDAAKTQASSNSSQTYYDIKRLIGRQFSDKALQDDLSKFIFEVKTNSDDQVLIGPGNLKPEQISAYVLSALKKYASAYLGQTVTKAVITVPAYFNDSQRTATKLAGEIAGLEVLKIINEPTAAALAYGLDKVATATGIKVLVFDFGGGTHDVTLLDLEDNMFDVLATDGNPRLGGEDIDFELVNYCLNKFILQNKDKTALKSLESDPETKLRVMRRLKVACEKAKRDLSANHSTKISVEALCGGIDFNMQLSRALFEDICSEIFRKTLEPVHTVLSDKKMKPVDIDKVVLVGGSTRIPKIRSLLADLFGAEKINESVNPDEAVAYGAAVHAAMLTGTEALGEIILKDVTPLSLGVATAGGIMNNIINKNTAIPCSETKIFTTQSDNQTMVTIEIFEGERTIAKENNPLGRFNLEIAPAPRGTPKIEVKFEVDDNGILNVSATDIAGNQTRNLVVTDNKNRLSEKQIQQMIQAARDHEEADIAFKKIVMAKNTLESFARNIKNYSQQERAKNLIDTDLRTKLNEAIADAMNLALDDKTTLEQCAISTKNLESIWYPIAEKMYKCS
jgi:L1 cell adhesion molecule like protein